MNRLCGPSPKGDFHKAFPLRKAPGLSLWGSPVFSFYLPQANDLWAIGSPAHIDLQVLDEQRSASQFSHTRADMFGDFFRIADALDDQVGV